MLDLTGSVSGVSQTYNVRQPSDQFQPITRVRDYRQNEFGAFFKDDWKIRPNLTLNLGVRFDYYGVPYEAMGAMTNPVGGTAGLFGLSGTSFADMWQPGKLSGSFTRVEWVGKNSPNPGRQIYNDDWNNFAPAVGFSWSLPWFGKEKTVLRAGFGTSYQGTTAFNNGLNLYIGGVPVRKHYSKLNHVRFGRQLLQPQHAAASHTETARSTSLLVGTGSAQRNHGGIRRQSRDAVHPELEPRTSA